VSAWRNLFVFIVPLGKLWLKVAETSVAERLEFNFNNEYL